MKKVLKGGTVVSGEGCKKADVLVEDGTVSYTHLDVYKRQLQYPWPEDTAWPLYLRKSSRDGIN